MIVSLNMETQLKCPCGEKLHVVESRVYDNVLSITVKQCPRCAAEEYRAGLWKGREVREDHRKHG